MTRNKPKKQSIYTALSVIITFTLLTLADALTPIYGIGYLYINNGQIIANNFCSKDGGYTWDDWDTCVYSDDFDMMSEYRDPPYTIKIPDTQTWYHLSEMGVVTISEDAGKTWHRLDKNIYFSEVMQYYQSQIRANAYIYHPGAQSMVYDPVSGNMIIANGFQGVVVISPESKAVQIGIGDNQPEKLINPWVFIVIMFPFFILTTAYMIICYGTLITLSRHFWYWLLNLAALSIWGFIALTFQEIFSGYAIVIGIPSLVVLIIFTIVIWMKTKNTLTKFSVNDKQHKLRYLKKVMPGGLAYLCCYLLWYLNVIPKRANALYVSLALALIWFIYCIVQSYRLRKSL